MIMLSGCSSLLHDSPAQSLVLPAPQTVDRMVISFRHPDEKPEVTITNRDCIAKFISFLNAHNYDWRKPSCTFPTPEYTVAFYRGNQCIDWFWISPGWIGGGAHLLRDISTDEWTTLVALLSLPS
jgi:hypothetical protein